MRKKEFMQELEEYLVGINEEDKKEILQDYEEHFKIGKKKKRNESEIIKSLGKPKDIARETRKELLPKESELRMEAKETWVATKKFTKNLLNNATEKISEIIQKDNKQKNETLPKIILGGIIILTLIIIFNSSLFKLIILGIVVYLLYDYFKNNNKTKRIHETKRTNKKNSRTKMGKTSTTKLILSLAFNILFFIYFWIGIGFSILGLFIAGIAMIIASIAIITFTTFALVAHSNPLTKDLLLAGLFSGIGILILGGLFTELTGWLIKVYFRLTRAYIELNSKFIRT